MKNPGVAAVLSFFIPGLGQLYNGQIGKFLLFLVLGGINIALTFILIGYVTAPITWLWAVIDAYKAAEAYNKGLTTVPASQQPLA